MFKSEKIKVKNFCSSKDTIKKVKRHPHRMGEKLANHISDQGIVSRIYIELLQMNNKWALKIMTIINNKKTT